MSLVLDIRPERLALRAPFRISRGVKTHAEVVVAELRDGDLLGRGECVPYPRYGETLASVEAQLAAAARRLLRGENATAILADLPAGAARNALDCAMWDLQARRSGLSVRERLGFDPSGPVPTAVTISLDTPEAMGAAAAAVADAPLLKVKVDDREPAACLRAVADAAPGARLIVDPNEGWTIHVLEAMAGPISRLNVVAVEQPLPAGQDEGLKGLDYPAPLCADESIHTIDDLPSVLGRYQMVNVKLDKAGGLTAALELVDAARALDLRVLAGCMVCSSLSIAPLLWVAAMADVWDLDGPWWLTEDRQGGCRFGQGVLYPPQSGFWGDPGPRP